MNTLITYDFSKYNQNIWVFEKRDKKDKSEMTILRIKSMQYAYRVIFKISFIFFVYKMKIHRYAKSQLIGEG